MIEVLDEWEKPTGKIVYGIWWNIGQVTPYCIGEAVAIHISPELSPCWEYLKIKDPTSQKSSSLR